jgi:hypothetical protein
MLAMLVETMRQQVLDHPDSWPELASEDCWVTGWL